MTALLFSALSLIGLLACALIVTITALVQARKRICDLEGAFVDQQTLHLSLADTIAEHVEAKLNLGGYRG